MMIDERTVRDIYNRLGDRESRRIFDERLAYYLTGNEEHLFRIVEGIPEAQYLRALLRCGERNYIFGCGRWGKVDIGKSTGPFSSVSGMSSPNSALVLASHQWEHRHKSLISKRLWRNW